jgi:hypothetical protein
MAEAVYLLCALASGFCALLLIRNYRATRTRLLLWSSLCFAGLALNNVLLVIDRVLLPPEVQLDLWRSIVALVAMLLLVFGLIWETR